MPKATPSSHALAKNAKDKKHRTSKKSEKREVPSKVLSTEFVEDSGDDSASDSDAESLPKIPSKSALTNNGKPPAPDGSDSSSENDSSSQESTEGEESGAEEQDDEDEEEVSQTAKGTNVPAPSAPPVVTTRAPVKYTPPTGFEKTTVKDVGAVSDAFKKSNLGGKQIWYFTAPASVPISSIENISLLDVKNGDTVYSKDGADYGFAKSSENDPEQNSGTILMIPSSTSEGYKTVSRPIDQVLHLRRIVSLPGVNDSGSASSKATVPAKKPVRQQPKGLKMRFLPIGFGEGDGGKLGSESSEESDVEMVDASNSVPAEPTKTHKTDTSSKKEASHGKKRRHEEKSGRKAEKKSKNSELQQIKIRPGYS
ncbi:hypothetical protein M7I_1293 [Glarea lozoyensis 74030]|uniref:DNA-directed RNA polymerase I subunit RPA34.5 n=1 Tax=Glarea lozoyensis (strain ATCC 74030 / MF5533) TaxID=1104152 RepID=H0EFL6_GLAL7|nr:hypothetical protein M7I_1293 [Glarea lozoyensis 74030]